MKTNNIDPLKLPYVFLTEKVRLPEASGVYFAIAPSDRIVYIGSSANLWKRWRGYHSKMNDLKDYRYIKIAWIEVAEGWMDLESRLINKFKPVLNIRGRHVMPGESEDFADDYPHLNREFMTKLIDGIVDCDPVSIVLGMEHGLI